MGEFDRTRLLKTLPYDPAMTNNLSICVDLGSRIYSAQHRRVFMDR